MPARVSGRPSKAPCEAAGERGGGRAIKNTQARASGRQQLCPGRQPWVTGSEEYSAHEMGGSPCIPARVLRAVARSRGLAFQTGTCYPGTDALGFMLPPSKDG